MLEQLNFSSRNRLQMTYQTEATECGLACLTMIARYHGHNVDLAGLRQKFSVSLKGVSLESLIDIAAGLDLGSRALRLELEELSRLQTPAILHWDLNHFVVLKKVTGRKVHIHDPAKGARILSLKDVSNHFTGVALELIPTPGFTKQTEKRVIRLSQVWGRLIGLKRAIIQLLILSIILQFIVLASPFYLQLVVDEALVKFDEKLLLILALGFGGLTIIQLITGLMREWTMLYFGYQMSYQMVANIFRHLVHLPTSYFEKRHVGDILSRMASTTPIQKALTQSVVTAIIDGFMAMLTGIVIFIYSPLLGAIVLLSTLMILCVTILFYPILRRSQEDMIIKQAHESSHKIETIRASVPIKLFSAQNQRLSIWRNLYADYINAGVAYGKYGLFQSTLQKLIAGLQTIAVVYFGAQLILSGENTFTVGMLFAFMAYRQSFTTSITSLFNKYIEFKLLGLHLERIADIVLAEPENGKGILPPQTPSPVSGKIELRNLRFRYSPSDPWVLDGLNLTIGAGEFAALTGPSGGGKTTLLKLMLGLYLPTEGEILVDGKPLTHATRITWRKHIGVVMQDDQLLSGSIADNISFFDPQVNMDKVYRVAKLAQIHDSIMAMPMSYLSMIGDMGSALSGGQKQRVLLARALYQEPKVLFLDEGTANLDLRSEALIVDAISKLDMTRIIVAHRPAFLSKAQVKVNIE